MAINKKHLRQLQTVILEEPKRLDMQHWAVKFLNGRKNDLNIKYVPPCKTVGCLAGWECLLHPKKAKELGWHGLETYLNLEEEAQLKISSISAPKAAVKLLGLTDQQAEILFYPSHWPSKWFLKLDKYNAQTKAYAKVVADFIQEVIDTNGQNLTGQYYYRYPPASIDFFESEETDEEVDD